MELFTTYLFLVPLVSFLVAQTIKFILRMLNGEFAPGVYLQSGGMPSAHASVVTALSVAVGLAAGVTSLIFTVVVVFTVVVLYDAMNVRREAGNHARTLNQILASALESKLRELGQLKENVGHKPSEVLAGVILGVLVAWLLLPVPPDKKPDSSSMTSSPQSMAKK